MDGCIRFSGPDAHSFLQGQITNDVALLKPGGAMLAAHCTPQGRVIAVMQLVQDGQDIIARLPAAMAELTVNKLRRYVLRAKVAMSVEPGALPASGSTLENIAAGTPQVYPQTSEAFVPQMLNLDLLGGISFNKGCYTGQEIVARAHYRGKVKRRMQRFKTLQPHSLSPGDSGRLMDGRQFEVVEAAQHADATCEFLAVTTLTAHPPAPDPTAAAAIAADASATLATEPLPLPYPLPE